MAVKSQHVARGASLKSPAGERLFEAGLIVLIAFGLYLVVALLSYDVADPSWANNRPREAAANWGGLFGAQLSHTLFFLFGSPAGILPLMCFVAARNLWRDKAEAWPHHVTQSAGILLIMIGSCGLASIHFAAGDLPATAGGIIGYYTAAGFLGVFGLIGSTLLLLSLLAVSLPMAASYSWLQLLDVLGFVALRLWEEAFKVPQRYDDWQAGRAAKVHRDTAVQRYKQRPRIAPTKEKIKVEPKIQTIKEGKRSKGEKQIPLLEKSGGFELPKLDLLDMPSQNAADKMSNAALKSLAELLQVKLADFGVDAEVVEVLPGPVVTRMELSLAPGVKASRVSNLESDLARALSKPSVRVQEVVPGKSVIGIELPNETREIVSLQQILSSDAYEKASSVLTLALGKGIAGEPVLTDLAKMPHLLVAGTTGAGKSVAVHAMLMSLLFRSSPEEVRLLLVDPKMLELNVYNGIPHLLTQVITDVTQAKNALSWVVNEMESRYRLMSELGVRNIGSYNREVKRAADAGKPLTRPVDEGETGEELKAMPYIVVVIDEFADMVMVIGKQVEQMIARLAQKARAAGIHLILATQRPSVDVITGLIKANIPSRIALQVSSKTDSRTIIDCNGAEQLLGQGDMLFLSPSSATPERVHGAYVSDHEVHAVAGALKKGAQTNYIDAVVREQPTGDGDGGDDPLYNEALAIVIESEKTSISYLQRRLRVGYNRAARLLEDMEAAGAVSPLRPDGTRDIYASAAPEA